MTVAELIEVLRHLDPALPVWVNCGDPYDTAPLVDVLVRDDGECSVELCA